MTTKWIEENWWFPLASAEEAKVEAFRTWLHGKGFEVCHSDGKWGLNPFSKDSFVMMSFTQGSKIRPCHPHRALIDQYEPGQEWEVSDSGLQWISCHPTFDVSAHYRLKQSATKPATAWQDEFEEWAKGKKLTTKGWFGAIEFVGWKSKNIGFAKFFILDKQEGRTEQVDEKWRDYIHEAEEFVEPYTQDTLPWPLVVHVDDADCLVVRAMIDCVDIDGGLLAYSKLATYKTPSGEPCGIRKWRKKA